MQTAVNFLIQQIESFGIDTKFMYGFIEQAKEMEKQQIIDAGNSCGMKMHLYIDKMEKMSVEQYIIEAHSESITFGEQYYNETYGSKGNDECKICEGNGYTVEIDLDCCGNCNEDGSCCNMPKQVQVQMSCICSKTNGNNVKEVPNLTSSQTEISDEEIMEGIIKHCKIPHDRILSEINAMIDGAKWYREQLKSRQ